MAFDYQNETDTNGQGRSRAIHVSSGRTLMVRRKFLSSAVSLNRGGVETKTALRQGAGHGSCAPVPTTDGFPHLMQ